MSFNDEYSKVLDYISNLCEKPKLIFSPSLTSAAFKELLSLKKETPPAPIHHFFWYDNVYSNIVCLYLDNSKIVHCPDGIIELGSFDIVAKTYIPAKSYEDISFSNIRGCFQDVKSIEYIILPSHLERIGACAFKNCVSLKSLIIPPSVTIIGEDAFYGCNSLEFVICSRDTPVRLTDFVDIGCRVLITDPSYYSMFGF